MDKGIYTALSGGIAKSQDIELIANNLANANTPGFKRDAGTFQESLVKASGENQATGDKSFVKMDGVFTDYRQGPLSRTSRPMDVALEGKGFFEVLTSNGIRYTRQGNFSVSAEGALVAADGNPILSTQSQVIRVGGGPVEITPEGVIQRGGQPLAQIAMKEFVDPQWLEKAGNSYYRNTRAGNEATESTTKAHQGFLEMSNVNAISEMTHLIEATRAYESHMQAIKTYQEIDGHSASSIAGIR